MTGTTREPNRMVPTHLLRRLRDARSEAERVAAVHAIDRAVGFWHEGCPAWGDEPSNPAKPLTTTGARWLWDHQRATGGAKRRRQERLRRQIDPPK